MHAQNLPTLIKVCCSEKNVINNFIIVIQIACRLYTNLTSSLNEKFDIRVSDGSLAVTGEFPWMVNTIFPIVG